MKTSLNYFKILHILLSKELSSDNFALKYSEISLHQTLAHNFFFFKRHKIISLKKLNIDFNKKKEIDY